MRFLVVSFLLVGLIALAVAYPDKKPGDASSEESNESGEACGPHQKKGCVMEEDVCEGPKADKCAKKCICEKGYFRKGTDCVTHEECGTRKRRSETSTCKDSNEQYLYCGSSCPPRCGDKPGKTCTQECVKGCFCKKGFILNSSNKCVSPDKC